MWILDLSTQSWNAILKPSRTFMRCQNKSCYRIGAWYALQCLFYKVLRQSTCSVCYLGKNNQPKDEKQASSELENRTQSLNRYVCVFACFQTSLTNIIGIGTYYHQQQQQKMSFQI